MRKIPQRAWDDCRATSERKIRTHSYDELVDLLIKLALERENDSHMEKFLKKHLGRGGTPTPERGKGKGPKSPTNANQGGGKGRGNLRAMNEGKPDAGTPPLFYCKPVNDKGGPCQHPPETPRMGIKVVKEVARQVAKVDPLTPRGAHQGPLLLPLLPKVTPRSAHRGITPPLRGTTPRRGDWRGWSSPSWLQGWMSNSLLRRRGAAPKRRTWFSGSS